MTEASSPSPPGEHKCRICMSGLDPENSDQVVSPCECNGTMEYVHKVCLKQWIAVKKSDKCEVCNTQYKLPLRVSRYMTYPEYADRNPRSLMQLLLILGAMAIINLAGSLIFGWLAVFKIAKHVIVTGTLPEPLSPVFCGQSIVYSGIVVCSGSFAFSTVWFHVIQFKRWVREHGAVYEPVV